MALPLAKGELIGTLLETICYGMYFMLFCQFLHVLYARHRAGRPILYLSVVAMLMFLLITAHLALQIHRIVQAFTSHMDVANAAITYFATLSVPESRAKASLYILLTLTCDTLLVYRVFIVHARKYSAIVAPTALLLTDFAVSIWFISGTSNKPYVHGTKVVKSAVSRINYFYAITLALNLLCTIMISWKIWAIHRKMPGPAVAGVRVMGVVAIILESAAIYSVALIALIVTSALGSTALWIILDPMCPIIGMVFSAVMVRTSKEYHDDTYLSADLSFSTPVTTRQMDRPKDVVTTSENDPAEVSTPASESKLWKVPFQCSPSIRDTFVIRALGKKASEVPAEAEEV